MSALYRTVNARSCCNPSITQQFNYNFSEFQQSNIPIPPNIFNSSFVFSVENPQTGNITCWEVIQTFSYATQGLQFVSTQPYKKCSGCLKDYPCQLYFKTKSCIGNLTLLVVAISGDDYFTDSGGNILTGPNGNTFIYDNGHGGSICLYLDEVYNGPINPDTIPVISDFSLGCDNCGEEDDYFYVYNVTQLCCDLHPGYGTSTVLVGPEGGQQGNTLLHNDACWVIQSFYETTTPPSFPIYTGEFYDGCAECIDDGKLTPCELTYRCIRCDGNPGTLIATVPQNIITSDANGNVVGDGSANVFIYNNICYHLYLPVPFTPSAIVINEFIDGSCVDCRTVEPLVTYRVTQLCCEFHNNYNQSTQLSGDNSGEVGDIIFYNGACWKVIDKFFNLLPVSYPYYYGEFYSDCPECFQQNDLECKDIEYKIYKAINCCDETLTFNVGINQLLSLSQGIGFLSDFYSNITDSSCYFIQGGGQLPGEFFIDDQEDLINNICNQRICLPCAEGFHFRAVQKCCEFHPNYNQIEVFQSTFEPTNGQIFFYNDACWIIDQPSVNQVEYDYPFVEEVYDDCPECFEDNNLVCAPLIEYKIRQVCCPTHPEYGTTSFMSSPFDYPTGQYVFLADACWQIVGNSEDAPNPYYYDGDSYSSCEQCWELNDLDCEGEAYEISIVPCCDTDETPTTMVVDVVDGITLNEGDVISILNDSTNSGGSIECFLITNVDLVYGEELELTIQLNQYFNGQTGLLNCKECQLVNSLQCPTTILQNCLDGLFYSVSFVLLPSFTFYPGTTYNILSFAQGGPEVSTNTCFVAVPDSGQNTLPMLLISSNIISIVEIGCIAPECQPTQTPTPTMTKTPPITSTITPTNTSTPPVTPTITTTPSKTPPTTPPITPSQNPLYQTWLLRRCCLSSQIEGLQVPELWPDNMDQIYLNIPINLIGSQDAFDTEFYPVFNPDGSYPGDFVHLNCYELVEEVEYDISIPIYDGSYVEDCEDCFIWNGISGCPVFPTPTPTVTITQTITQTQSNTPTHSVTPSITKTSAITPTPTKTASITSTPTLTENYVPPPTLTPTPGLTSTPIPILLEKYVLCGGDPYDCQETIYKFNNFEQSLSELFGVTQEEAPALSNVLNEDSIFVGFNTFAAPWIFSNPPDSDGNIIPRFVGYWNSDNEFEIVTDNPLYAFYSGNSAGIVSFTMEQGDNKNELGQTLVSPNAMDDAIGGGAAYYVVNRIHYYNTDIEKYVFGFNSGMQGLHCVYTNIYTDNSSMVTYNPIGFTSSGGPNASKPGLLQTFAVVRDYFNDDTNYAQMNCRLPGRPLTQVIDNSVDPFENERNIIPGLPIFGNATDVDSTVLMTTSNSNLYTGFYSKCGFDKYVHSATLQWPNVDNDICSIVIAAFNDTQGQYGPKNLVHYLTLNFDLKTASPDIFPSTSRYCTLQYNYGQKIYGFRNPDYNNEDGEFWYDTPGAIDNGFTTVIKKIYFPENFQQWKYEIDNSFDYRAKMFSFKIEKEFEIIKIYITARWNDDSNISNLPGLNYHYREYKLIHTLNLFDPDIGDENSLPPWANKELLHMFVNNARWGYAVLSQTRMVISNIYFSGSQVNNQAVLYRTPDSEFVPEINQTYFFDDFYGCYEYVGNINSVEYDNLPLTFNDISGPNGLCETCDPGPPPINLCGSDFNQIQKISGIGIYNINVNIGTQIGDVEITIDCNPVPQRFEIYWNGELVCDSLFIGNGLYNSFDSISYQNSILQPTILDVYEWNGSEFILSGTQSFTESQNSFAPDYGTRVFGSIGDQVGVVPSYPSDESFAYDGEIKLRFSKSTPLNGVFTIKVYNPINSSFTIQSITCPEFQVTPNPTLAPTQTVTPTQTPSYTPNWTGETSYTRFIHIPNN